ncbi:uncharacterized protein [Cherax quadricarinatus]
MKGTAIIPVILAAVCMQQAAAEVDAVETLVNTIRETFGGLNAKRDQWFDNYSVLKQLLQKDQLQLNQILFVSKMAIPMIWHLYATQVIAQKTVLPKLLNDKSKTLPYNGTILAPIRPIFHVEITLVLHEFRNFQVEILQDSSQQIFHLNFDFKERHASLGERSNDGVSNERVVLHNDQFPAINLHQPFRVNVQVADDCIFASIWPGNLNLDIPLPLPVKYSWCTKDHHTTQSFSVIVHYGMESASSDESHESLEDTQDALHHQSDIQLIAATIYDGILAQ